MTSSHTRIPGQCWPVLGAEPARQKGTPCQVPAVVGIQRCRMHGGANKGSGAPKGNQNALKHGLYSAETKAFNRHVRKILADGRKMIE